MCARPDPRPVQPNLPSLPTSGSCINMSACQECRPLVCRIRRVGSAFLRNEITFLSFFFACVVHIYFQKSNGVSRTSTKKKNLYIIYMPRYDDVVFYVDNKLLSRIARKYRLYDHQSMKNTKYQKTIILLFYSIPTTDVEHVKLATDRR